MEQQPPPPPRFDPIPGTNSCSTESKFLMSLLGYCQDSYLIKYFGPAFNPRPRRRAPIINRGYYVRFKAVEYGWQQVFLPNHMNIIITLGCGFDTTPFRYSKLKNAFFIEIDYPSVCREKAKIIQQNNLIPNVKNLDDDGEQQVVYLASSNYLLLGLDLRNIDGLVQFFESDFFMELVNGSCPEESGQDEINFILFNECSLCYIEQNSADELIRSLMVVLEQKFLKQIHCITYLGYEMLRSSTCRNDFGKFLLAHFQSLGAGILTFLNEEEIQERFTKSLDFDQVQIINMKRFCREILWQDSKECLRIQSLEPFDEWEELDNVCASYALTICRKWFKQPQPQPAPSPLKQQVSSDWLHPTTNHPTELHSSFSCQPPLISVFGHCTEYDPDRRRVQIVGGFGFMSGDHHSKHGQHGRLKNLVELDLTNVQGDFSVKANVIEPKNSKSIINRIHCRMVRLDDNHILLSGGRTCPSKPLPNSIIKLDREANQFELIQCSGQYQPDPTYRHVCCRFGHHSGQLIQFGGRNPYHSCSVDVMDILSSVWTSSNLGIQFNVSRHSMAFGAFGAHSILVNGGLDFEQHNFCGRNLIELIDQRYAMPSQFPIKNFDQKLYSHRMKIVGDHEIFIIGGIGNEYIGNEVYRIDFRSLKVVQKFQLVSQDQDGWLMLQNFDCELIDHKNLWIIGGGGNCFSFGTHFNPIVSFEL